MSKINEVIRKEGDEIVLYSSDGKKVLGRFPFGKGKKYADEDAARAAAHKREGQVQFFKHQGEALRPAVLQAVTALCDQVAPLLESAGTPLREAGIDAIIARWKSWAGSYRKCVEVLTGKEGIDEPEALCAWLHNEAEGKWPGEEALCPAGIQSLLSEAGQVKTALEEVGARHTQAEIALIDKIVKFLQIIRDGEVTAAEAEELKAMGITVKPTTESAQQEAAAPADSFEDRSRAVYDAWRALYPWQEGVQQPDVVGTYEGYVIVRDGAEYYQAAYEVDEGGAIAFAARGDWTPVVLTWQPVTAASTAEPVQEAAPIVEQNLEYTIALHEAAVDDAGNLDCILIEAGESANGNVYDAKVLEAALPHFVGAQMFVDHPARSEEKDRPERSVRDLAGKISAARMEGTKVRATAKISEATPWLKTLIREGIAGDLSINATGQGRKEGPKFVVEAITGVRSVDFVTKGAAKGRVLAVLEAESRPAVEPLTWEALTIEALSEHRPDILNELTSRERDKLYRGKEETLREAEAAPALREELATAKKHIEEIEGQCEARAVADVVEQLLRESSLPSAALDEVRRQLAGASLADAPVRAAQAIQAQKNLVAQVLEAGSVRGHGSTTGGTEEAHRRLVEAYIAGGLTHEQAEIAACGRM